MTLTGPRRKVAATYEQLLKYIEDLCGNAEAGQLGQIAAWRPGKRLFDLDLDYETVAKCSGEEPIRIFDAEVTPKGIKLTGTFKDFTGPALTEGEIADAIIRAIGEKEPARRKGGLKEELVTTNNILFQIYLIKIALRAAS